MHTVQSGSKFNLAVKYWQGLKITNFIKNNPCATEIQDADMEKLM
jgi:hypothetical protein